MHYRARAVWSSDPAVTARFNKLKAWLAMSESECEKYKEDPPAVNFATAKKNIRDAALVNQLEAFYNASTPAPEVHEFPEDERIQTEENIAFLKELDAYHKEYKPVLQEEIDFQKNNRTSTETTIFDMQCNYPLIHEEIEDELERREWFKDTGLGGGGK